MNSNTMRNSDKFVPKFVLNMWLWSTLYLFKYAVHAISTRLDRYLFTVINPKSCSPTRRVFGQIGWLSGQAISKSNLKHYTRNVGKYHEGQMSRLICDLRFHEYCWLNQMAKVKALFLFSVRTLPPLPPPPSSYFKINTSPVDSSQFLSRGNRITGTHHYL